MPPNAEAVLDAVMRAMGVEAPREDPQAPELMLIDEPGVKCTGHRCVAPAEDVELHSAMIPLPSRICRPGSIYSAVAARPRQRAQGKGNECLAHAAGIGGAGVLDRRSYRKPHFINIA